MKNKYLVLVTWWQYGQVVSPTEKEKVREQCEFYKNNMKAGVKNCYQRIEVVNTETGEIREYWNNHENKIEF